MVAPDMSTGAITVCTTPPFLAGGGAGAPGPIHMRRAASAVDAGACLLDPTTVIDLTGPVPQVIRRGRGDPAELGLD